MTKTLWGADRPPVQARAIAYFAFFRRHPDWSAAWPASSVDAGSICGPEDLNPYFRQEVMDRAEVRYPAPVSDD